MANRAERRSFAASADMGGKLKQAGLANGIAVYPSSGTVDGITGNHVMVVAPYVVTAAQVDEIVE